MGLLLAACGSARQKRYDDLQALLREAAATPATHGGDGARDADDGESVDGYAADEGTFAHDEVLDRATLVRLVLERNPDVEVARLSALAALERYRQVTALPDPMVDYAIAPLTVAGGARFGQRVIVSQRFPWPGTLAARGEVALAQAESEAERHQIARLELALAASRLFDAYYANARSLELVAEHRALVESILETSRTQYTAGLASQQEPLQAEVELAHVEHHQVVFQHQRDVLVAQLNQLLHRPPQRPLPPAPAELEVSLPEVDSPEALQRLALEHRPEMSALRGRLAARRAAIDAADLDYWPSFGVMGSYNSMWMETEHQWMVGLSVDIPIQRGRRDAAVDEAEAELAAEMARVASLVAEIRTEVETARHHVIEGRHVVELFRERLLPAARQQIEAARIAYSTGRGDFQGLIDAERSLRRIELEYQQALANLQQRQAELERSVGRVPGAPGEDE